ncbi:MAG: potassium-transporting ATPase subunit KdpC [Bacteroidales bacterium]
MKTLFNALMLFLILTLVTGVAYPLFITGVAQIAFHENANGSLIVKDKTIAGSELIGQQFDSVIYFTSRPSVLNYNPLPSGGSNYGLTNTKLKNLVDERKKNFIGFNHLDSNTVVPSEMLFASGSGLDPHISPEAALLEVDRISKARNFNNAQVQNLKKLIENNTELPQYLLFGQKRINVLKLNMELDKL